MTIRVENGSNVAFGRFATGVTVTHVRVETAGGTVLFTRPLTAGNTAVAANNEFELPKGEIDSVHPEGHWEDPGMKDLIDTYFNGTRQLTVRAMTSSSAEVSVTGYSAQKTADWDVSTE